MIPLAAPIPSAADGPWRARFVDENGLVEVRTMDTPELHWLVTTSWKGVARKAFRIFWIDPWASEVVYRP